MHLYQFDILPAKHRVEQDRILEWIANMHGTAEQKKQSLKEEQKIALVNQLKTLIHKAGLGKDKIAYRGMQNTDLLSSDLASMKTYDLTRSDKGCGLKEKMNFFSEESFQVFKSFYHSSSLPDHLIHVTCTGYVSPSPAQRIVSEKKCESTFVTHAYHMGCYGALPAIRIAANGNKKTDIIHTEMCSLHMNPTNHSLGQLVVESLFADGFIKYSFSHVPPCHQSYYSVLALHEVIIPDSTQSMSWQCEDWGFGMFLSKDVPAKIAYSIQSFLKNMAAKANVSLDEMFAKAYFAIHPGGPKIISQIQERLNLSNEQVKHSHHILYHHGNMSSATLPHVWKAMLDDTEIPSGTLVLSMAFGPGLTISGAIFKKETHIPC
jgi:predicted naringenin-chalcone synthase